MRQMFEDYLDTKELSKRTRHVYKLVADEIMKLNSEFTAEDAMLKAKDALKDAGVKPSTKKGKENEAEALFFMSLQQAKNVAALALGEIDAKAVKNALNGFHGIELALFGRMVASDPELNCDASVQVAHAISTHRVENEYDYFTAVDDLAKEVQEHAGGAHLGTVEYNSATLYRYATVAVHELYYQLADDGEVLEKALQEFTRAFICSMPTGKQNTFAAHTMPEAVLAVIRVDRPLNLADAFETPVNGKDGEGLVSASAKSFIKRANEAYADYDTAPEKSYVIGNLFSELGDRLSLEELLTRLSREARETL